jgi:tyrosine-protein phosphatase YwqE
VVASDSHNLEARPPVISAARDVLAQLFGKRAAEQMVAVRPAQILGIDAS